MHALPRHAQSPQRPHPALGGGALRPPQLCGGRALLALLLLHTSRGGSALLRHPDAQLAEPAGVEEPNRTGAPALVGPHIAKEGNDGLNPRNGADACMKVCEGGIYSTDCQERCACPIFNGEAVRRLLTRRRSKFDRYNEPQEVLRVQGLAVLENVSTSDIYTMGELLFHHSSPWRRNFIQVLAARMYRGTLLRSVLKATASFEGGDSLATLPDAEVERRMAKMDEGSAGFACSSGDDGPSGLRLKDPMGLLPSLAEAVQDQLWQHVCFPPGRHDLVVTLHLDEKPLNERLVVQAVDEQLKNHRRKIDSLIFSAAVRLDGSAASQSKSEMERIVQEHSESLRRLISMYKMLGIDATLRSEASADAEICFITCAPNLVQQKAPFAEMVARVRLQACAPHQLLVTAMF